MQAPFNLSENKILDFGSSWRMVSKAPAEAAGLTDRGEIIEGKRADLILIEQLDLGDRKLKATFVNGAQYIDLVGFKILFVDSHFLFKWSIFIGPKFFLVRTSNTPGLWSLAYELSS